MADENKNLDNDTLDINELASLNDDISAEFIEQLQSRVAQTANEFTGRNFITESDDSTLFEEIAEAPVQETAPAEKEAVNIEPKIITSQEEIATTQETIEVEKTKQGKGLVDISVNAEIENLTSGNIIEKPLTQEQLNYNESLDFLDENVKYSKYVIYVNPENKDFIESLTVKERKNLINRLLREQDDIAITKRKMSLIQTVIKHSIIAILTIAITIPAVYWTINASLEASINNYRRSKVMFNKLYREKGKIKTQNQY